MSDERLLTIPEVAELLLVNPARACELARSGYLPVVRIGRQLRVHPARLREWIEGGGVALEDYQTGEEERRA